MSDIKYQHTDFPALSPDAIAAHYNEQAPTYDAGLVFVDRTLGMARRRQELFARARGDVLEVATGTGGNLQYLRPDQVKSITATDLSPGMLEIAKQETAKRGIHAEFHVMNAQDLKFPDATFDTVISSLATCTFPDPIKALKEMARVCKPDGRILLLEHGRSRVGIIGWLQDRGAHSMYSSHACRWNQDTQALMKASGLRMIEMKSYVFGIFHSFEATPV
jgi:ubiquinone/menaquinone biosynthesis C-methylase UbiE